MIPDLLKEIPKLYSWLEEVIALTEPDSVSLFLDPIQDDKKWTDLLLQKKVLHPLKRPNSYYIATDPEDTARVEESTFICTETEAKAGVTNNWKDPREMKAHLKTLFKGCMHGREMIIIPYVMGEITSPYAVLGVEVTDSPYVALNMRRMARCGQEVLPLFKTKKFVPGIHSVGVPLKKGQKDVAWPCNPEKRVIAHFPETQEIYSFGSGYGGNALLGKKCLALRIASYLGLKEGWLAEHMLIMGIENPQGIKKYIAAAFPSACGKTNLAMLESIFPGWKITCVGDDIAWIHIDKKGQWRAINPEFGFFGVAPGTSWQSNPTAMRIIEKDTLFTNTGYTLSGDVYWEGMGEVPKDLMTWKNKPYDGSEKAAHPNSRFTSPLENCDRLDPDYKNPLGVKLDAILFGGRRSEAVPLIAESLDFAHGVYFGATLSSEMTAAAKGEVGKVRRDPFAMLPFCGYNMATYFDHWLKLGADSHPPKIFQVNWFRKDKAGNYIWPGFGQNLRVLQWVFGRLEGNYQGHKRPYGVIPKQDELNLEGLDVNFEALFELSPEVFQEEAQDKASFLKRFGKDLPKALEKILKEEQSL